MYRIEAVLCELQVSSLSRPPLRLLDSELSPSPCLLEESLVGVPRLLQHVVSGEHLPRPWGDRGGEGLLSQQKLHGLI